MKNTLWLLSLIGSGCGSLGDAPVNRKEQDTSRQFVAHQIQWTQAEPEILKCHYFKLTNETPIEVDRLTIDFPEGSHHVHVYRSDTPHRDGIEDCWNGIDWTVWSFLLGAQTTPMDMELPDGVTAPLAPHQQLMVQVHWLNGTRTPIGRTIDITAYVTNRSVQHLGVGFGISKDVRALPQTNKSVAAWFAMPAGVKMLAAMGHFHARGTRFLGDLRPKGALSGLTLYSAGDEDTLVFKRFNPMPVTQPGQGMAYECDYVNNLDITLTWGANTMTQEHCNFAAYYFPAQPTDQTVFLSGEVHELTVDQAALTVGQETMGQVTLEVPAGPLGVDVNVTPSDDSVQLPGGSNVHVQAWGQMAQFPIKAMHATHGATLAATVGAAVFQSPAIHVSAANE
jgi:hypothetical protein